MNEPSETADQALCRLENWIAQNLSELSDEAVKEIVSCPLTIKEKVEFRKANSHLPPSFVEFYVARGPVLFRCPEYASEDNFQILSLGDAKEHQLEMECAESDVDDRDASHLLLFGTNKQNPLDALVFNSHRRDSSGEMAVENWYHGEYKEGTGPIKGFDLWMSEFVNWILSHRGEV